MGTSALRQPQFSQDIAWLPSWLQPHQDPRLDDHIKTIQTPSQQACKDPEFPHKNVSGREDVNLLIGEDARYNSCHLYLSGTDDSTFGVTPSSENVMHFHLHLSSNGTISQHTQSPICDRLPRDESNGIPYVQPLAKTSAKNMEFKDGTLDEMLKSKSSALNSRSRSLTKDSKNSGKKHQEKFGEKKLVTADIKDAVELSIAASEALVISETVNCESTSKILPASAVLEVALRLKQERNDWCTNGWENAFDCKADQVDETDLLQDLDEDIMADACEDVGLFISPVVASLNQCGSSSVIKQRCSLPITVSRVLDSPDLGNCCGCNTEVDNSNLKAQELEFDVISSQRTLEDVLQDKLNADPHLFLDTSSAERHLEPCLSLRTQTNSKVATTQDVGVSVEIDANNCKRAPKVFIDETSFISESAEYFPDQHSCVNKLERRNPVLSLASVECQEVLYNTPDKGIMLSQDHVTCSSMSLADPLCSVVPCSISSDNADVTVTANKIEESGNCLHHPLEHGFKSSYIKTTRVADKSGHTEENMFRMSDEGSGATTRKKLTSLQSYSMILPLWSAHSEKENAYQIESVPSTGIIELLAPKEGIDPSKSSNEKDSTEVLFLEPTLCYGRVNEKRQKQHMEKSSNDKAYLQLQNQENECSPVILNYGPRYCLQTPKMALSKVIGDGSSERASIPENNVIDCMDRSIMAPLPILHSVQLPDPCENQGPSEKRVRFSDNVVNVFHQSRTASKSQSVCQTRSSTRAGKRLKRSSIQSDLRVQEDATRVKYLPKKERKRMIFQGLEFFLTGLTSKRERELEALIRKHGGFLGSDVPPPPHSGRCRRSRSKLQQLPIFLSPKKLQTAKFLYGCALNAFLLKVNWLTDSVGAGSLLSPENYLILPNRDDMQQQRIGWPVRCVNRTYIFDRVGMMLHGKHSSCTKLARIVKHGGGKVYKTLQWLLQSLNYGKISVGVVVAEDEGRISRHLRQCAFEQKLPVMPVSWIVESLHSGKLIPFEENNTCFTKLKIKIPDLRTAMELSPEI